jgi:hypothetical protein
MVFQFYYGASGAGAATKNFGAGAGSLGPKKSSQSLVVGYWWLVKVHVVF